MCVLRLMITLSPICCSKVPGHGSSAKSGGLTNKKYIKMGGGPPVPSSKVFSQLEVIERVLHRDWLAISIVIDVCCIVIGLRLEERGEE